MTYDNNNKNKYRSPSLYNDSGEIILIYTVFVYTVFLFWWYSLVFKNKKQLWGYISDYKHKKE